MATFALIKAMSGVLGVSGNGLLGSSRSGAAPPVRVPCSFPGLNNLEPVSACGTLRIECLSAAIAAAASSAQIRTLVFMAMVGFCRIWRRRECATKEGKRKKWINLPLGTGRQGLNIKPLAGAGGEGQNNIGQGGKD